MWRPETIREKEAREHPKTVVEPIGKKPVVQHNQVADDQALKDAGCGWFVDCAKIIEYVICCCGCCSSYESYFDND
jgi:hypothetical protein